ncbi:MAG: hypothetical protein AB7O96_04545 [Pseudobdellovibrionaceae bacterium]
MSGNNFKRASLISIALLAVLTTACEKKKKKLNLAFGIVPKEQKVPVPVVPAKQPTVTIVPQKPPTTPAPEKGKDKGPGGGLTPDPDKNKNPKPDGGGDADSEGGSGSGENVVDNKDNDEAILNSSVEKHLTGGANKGLDYTGSSEDGLLPFLRKRADTASAVSKERNNAFAKQIEDASIEFVKGGQARIRVTIKGPMTRGRSLTLVLGGEVAPNSSSDMKLSREQARLMPNLVAKLYCVDSGDSCESSFLRLANGVQGERSIIAIILRSTKTGTIVDFPKDMRSTPEFDIFSRYLWNTSSGFNEPNKFEKVLYRSFEVVYGKSGFRTTLIAGDSEVLSFGAPLLAPEKGSSVNLSVDRTVPNFVRDMDGYGENLLSMIDEVRLVSNNGQGRVRVSVRLNNSSEGKEGAFYFTFVRKVKPLMTLSDESLGLE